MKHSNSPFQFSVLSVLCLVALFARLLPRNAKMAFKPPKTLKTNTLTFTAILYHLERSHDLVR